MQIKTTIRYYCTPTRKAQIKKTNNTSYWWANGTETYRAWGGSYKMMQPFWRTEFLERLNTELLLGILLKRNENRRPNKNLYKNVHSSIIHVSPEVKTTQMFITKEWIQHIFKIHWMENYLAIKWNKVYLNIENIMLTEISQTQNATYCTNSIYMKCSE